MRSPRASVHVAVHGYSQMNKEHLLPAICQALGIDTIEHHAAAGIDKSTIKARMRASLKAKREAALEAQSLRHVEKYPPAVASHDTRHPEAPFIEQIGDLGNSGIGELGI